MEVKCTTMRHGQCSKDKDCESFAPKFGDSRCGHYKVDLDGVSFEIHECVPEQLCGHQMELIDDVLVDVYCSSSTHGGLIFVIFMAFLIVGAIAYKKYKKPTQSTFQI